MKNPFELHVRADTGNWFRGRYPTWSDAVLQAKREIAEYGTNEVTIEYCDRGESRHLVTGTEPEHFDITEPEWRKQKPRKAAGKS